MLRGSLVTCVRDRSACGSITKMGHMRVTRGLWGELYLLRARKVIDRTLVVYDKFGHDSELLTQVGRYWQGCHVAS